MKRWIWYKWYRLRRAESYWLWIARHLPRSLQYWCAIRVGAHATTGKYSSQLVPDLRFMEALERWEK